jgi:hypothetical protein
MAMFPAEHCTFRTVDHLCELCKECSGEGQTGEKSEIEEKKNLLELLLGPHFRDDLRIHIGNSKCVLVAA